MVKEEAEIQSNVNGAQAIEVLKRIFGGEFNEILVHQAAVVCMTGGRQGSEAQKTHSEASGGGKEPWYQKGTGRARVGTIRSPIWYGGGTTFTTKPHSHEQKLNKRMHRATLRPILAELICPDRLVVVADFVVDALKAKSLVAKLDTLGLKDILVVIDGVDENLYPVARNLTYIDVHDVQGSDPVSLIAYDKASVAVSAVKGFEELSG